MDVENEVSKHSKVMKIPNQLDNVDYGAKRKVTTRKVEFRDTATGELFGSRTIATKEALRTSFIDHLMERNELNDLTLMPDAVLSEIKKNIRDGAKDTTQLWSNALELVNKAYQVTNIRIPAPEHKGAWKQYEDMISYGVSELARVRGIGGKWRSSEVMMRESSDVDDIQPMGKVRFFVEVPGEVATEVIADDMDDIIDTICNKLKRNGSNAKVAARSELGAVLDVFSRGVPVDRISIKQLS